MAPLGPEQELYECNNDGSRQDCENERDPLLTLFRGELRLDGHDFLLWVELGDF